MPNGKEWISINMSAANFDILTTMFEFNSFGQSLKEQILIEGKEGDLNRFVFMISEGGFSAMAMRRVCVGPEQRKR